MEKVEHAPAVLAIKSGLISIFPVLIIGAAALVSRNFPISCYQQCIETALSGKLVEFFDFIYNATFGMLAVYLTYTISYQYVRQYDYNRASLASPLTSLICFSILSGVKINTVTWDALGVKGVFIAIISALLATRMQMMLTSFFEKRIRRYNEGSDVEFNYSVFMILPTVIVVFSFGLFNLIITSVFHTSSVYELFVSTANAIVIPLGRSFASGLLMVLGSSLLWFFGIHGSNVLEAVTEQLFTPAIAINMELVALGQAPTEIFTKQFFDVFILMGGCGTALCLLIALALFSKQKRNMRLAKLAIIPLLFNVNELLIFGYPVIFNIVLFIPFMLTPLVSFLITYSAMSLGWVPLTAAEVNWTTPVLLSGYMVTGSIAGVFLQLFTIGIGVLIYRPFVKIYDAKSEVASKRLITELVDMKKMSEETLTPVVLTGLNDKHGTLARSLASDLKFALSRQDLQLYYQPQYDNHGKCVGAESLLRWNHPIFGMMYPPLVIEIARESKMLTALETYVFIHAVKDAKIVREETRFDGEISVNISAATLQTPKYQLLLKRFIESDYVGQDEICLEITEQTALRSGGNTTDCLNAVKNLGYRLAIDDFSMGHTSLAYLQENYFDVVKLDGALVTDMMKNSRSYDIVKTITALSKTLGFSVIAEYVETKEQVAMLEAVGCFHYQGYLFSKAIERDALIEKLLSEKI
ncbi:MAG: EAL domain-containing protein [Desulfovibrionaceae bacterium]|nr:EAL domain-containing protein [Desulfovibrionaceae bacterium]